MAKKGDDDKDFEIVKVKAIMDKETKRTYRYLIESDDADGISGVIYMSKDKVKSKKPQKSLFMRLKVRI